MARHGESDTSAGDTGACQLHGRDGELRTVSSLIGRLSEGRGGALVVRGEPGIGKSALLAAVRARAEDDGLRVLSALGVQSEARLPFAGLHQLLRPVLHGADQLPAPQRAALLAAFGMSDQAGAGLFLIGLATLELIGDAAESSPVLVLADDAHWLDEPSCAVLAFAGRRLAAERAVMLIAVRDGAASPFDQAQLPELRLAGLDKDAAGALLDSRAPGLEPFLRERLIAEAAGNPLALVELPEALRAEDPVEGALAPSRLPLTARLERAFAVQESGLPTATRSLLLVAAADDSGILGEVLDAASGVGSVAGVPRYRHRGPAHAGAAVPAGPGAGIPGLGRCAPDPRSPGDVCGGGSRPPGAGDRSAALGRGGRTCPSDGHRGAGERRRRGCDGARGGSGAPAHGREPHAGAGAVRPGPRRSGAAALRRRV